MTYDRMTLALEGESESSQRLIKLKGLGAYFIGRDPNSDLFIADPRVAREHCRIFLIDGRPHIEATSQRAKTLVNSKALHAPQELDNGDIISVGSLSIRVGLTQMEDPNSQLETQVNTADAPWLESSKNNKVTLAMSPDDSPEQRGEHTVLYEEGESAQIELQQITKELGEAPITVGRDIACGLHLDHLAVSRQHARIERKENSVLLTDLGSSNGTFVDGAQIGANYPLQPGALISFGPLQFIFDGKSLASNFKAVGAEIAVAGLGKKVTDRATGKPLWLLKNIMLTIRPGEFVGLMGASGSGKSTFMDTINGRRPATHGEVYYDGDSLHRNFESLKGSIGHVPQEVIFHENLTLEDALQFTSKLRLSTDVTDNEISENITETLKIVGLGERRGTRIRDLSGGQKKRVSIAMELLSKPRTLFLDEVTSGLDLGTEKQMMTLFRSLADRGITIACITHFVDSLDACNMVAYFGKGQLLFFGTPDEMKSFFEVEKISDVYALESSRPIEEWVEKYKNSKLYKRHILARKGPIAFEEEEDVSAQDKIIWSNLGRGVLRAVSDTTRSLSAKRGHIRKLIQRPSDFKSQLKLFSKRYATLLLYDKTNLSLLIGLAPIIGALLCILGASIDAPDNIIDVATPEDAAANEKYAFKQLILCFGGLLTVFFLGLFGSIREVVKELDIYRHERFGKLQIIPYYCSKMFLLSLLGLLQTLLVLEVTRYFGGLNVGTLLQEFIALYMISIAGILLGLAISCAVRTSDWAIIIMFAIVIPQILFAGAVVEVQGVAEVLAEWFVVTYWGLESLKGLFPEQVRTSDSWLLPLLAVSVHQAFCFILGLYFLIRKEETKVFRALILNISKRGRIENN